MAVQKIAILGKESIHVGFNLVQHIADTLLDTLPSSIYVLITDTNIAPLYLESIRLTFTQATDARFPVSDPARPRFLTYTIPPGETTKSREGKAEIEDFLLRHRCTRDTVIIALGGGVIGDLVGFVAATLCVGFFWTCYVTDSNLFQYAWCTRSPSADVTPCNGRLCSRRKNGRRHTPRQESYRSILAALLHLRRRSFSEHTSLEGTRKWSRRSYQGKIYP